jgi:hypothetical protein
MSMPPSQARRAGPGIGDDLGPVDPDIGVQDVFLRHLSVKPNVILPFGAAVLRWEIDAPPTVQITINDELAPQIGSRVVRPTYSTTYRVLARRGQRQTELGRVDLTVDRSLCTTSEILNPVPVFAATLDNWITLVDGVRTQFPAKVRFDPNRITFELYLSGERNSSIHIKGSFGVTVIDGRVASTTNQVSADVQFPWYLWLIPGAMIGLAIARDGAREKATAAGFSLIKHLVELIEAYWNPRTGMARHHVRIDRTEDGVGVLETTDCPTTPLDQLAELGEDRVVIG